MTIKVGTSVCRLQGCTHSVDSVAASWKLSSSQLPGDLVTCFKVKCARLRSCWSFSAPGHCSAMHMSQYVAICRNDSTWHDGNALWLSKKKHAQPRRFSIFLDSVWDACHMHVLERALARIAQQLALASNFMRFMAVSVAHWETWPLLGYV